MCVLQVENGCTQTLNQDLKVCLGDWFKQKHGGLAPAMGSGWAKLLRLAGV